MTGYVANTDHDWFDFLGQRPKPCEEINVWNLSDRSGPGTFRVDVMDGRTYYPMHGKRIAVPRQVELRSDPQALMWHNEQVFRG